MKPLPLWSLRKLPKTGVYALSSPCRTTSLFVSKESDGRIFHDPREKEDVLSLKMKKKAFCIPFLLSHVWSSPLSYPSFCFSFLYSHFSSHFSFTFSSFSPFSFLFSPPIWRTLHIRSKEEIASPFPQTKGVAMHFPSLFLIFLKPLL